MFRVCRGSHANNFERAEIECTVLWVEPILHVGGTEELQLGDVLPLAVPQLPAKPSSSCALAARWSSPNARWS